MLQKRLRRHMLRARSCRAPQWQDGGRACLAASGAGSDAGGMLEIGFARSGTMLLLDLRPCSRLILLDPISQSDVRRSPESICVTHHIAYIVRTLITVKQQASKLSLSVEV
jgi:hypothetical protein